MQITFNKVCGEERVMHCTLHESKLPETSNNKKINENTLKNNGYKTRNFLLFKFNF